MSPSDDPTVQSFRSLVLQLRGRTGLTQRDLAARLGVHVHSIRGWETGNNYPGVASLQALIVVFLHANAFAEGQEKEEAEGLWAAALHDAPRFRTPFDSAWFERILAGLPGPVQVGTESAVAASPAPGTTSGRLRRESWGEAPDVDGFIGRAADRAMLRRCVLDERSRLVVLLGLGGIGKTLLATRVARDLAPDLDYVCWRSLRDAPSPGEWLAQVIGLLAPDDPGPSRAESAQVRRLLELLSGSRCLLILDNFETVLEPGGRAGTYRPGYERYGALLRQVAEAPHRSCLIITSREAPSDLGLLRGENGPVRMHALTGLPVEDGRALLSDKRLDGNDAAWQALVGRYGGNGLALRVVGETIRQAFTGDISAFLDYVVATDGTVFGGIRRLLDTQAERLSPVELDVLRRLAVEREPVSLMELSRDMAPSADRIAVIDAIDTLRRRSLVERGERAATFTLQSMVLEYVTDRLIADVADEIACAQPVLLAQQPLIKALAKEYVRQSQERLIGEPILQRLKADRSPEDVEQLMLTYVDRWRSRPRAEQAYGPGNVVNLLRLLRGDLRATDLSRLSIRQAYLAQVGAQDASLVDAHLVDSLLAEAFEFTGYVALNADGSLLAAGTVTGEIWLWRVADRTPLWMVHGHTGAVYSVALSADGQWVTSGGADRTIRVWEASTGRQVTILEGHSGAVRAVAFTADGQLLASGCADGTVRLWEVGSGRSRATMDGDTGGGWDLALSADGRLLGSCGGDATVRLWDTHTQQVVAALDGHVGTVWNVALSGDGRFVASAGGDGTVRVWETQTQRPVATLQGHASAVYSVAMSADGKLLASGGADSTLRLWETETGRPLATLWGHTGPILGIAISAQGQLVASGGGDWTVRLWTAAPAIGWRQEATLQGITDAVRGVALSADSQLGASAGADGIVRLWDVGSGRLRETMEGHTGGVWDVAMSADGRCVVSAGMDETVRVWQSTTGTPVWTLRGHNGAVYAVAMSAGGELVASGGTDGTVRLWDTDTGQSRATLHGHTGMVYSMALSSDGRLLASGGADGTVRLWDVSSTRQVAILRGHTSVVRDLALSTAGRLLVSGSFDGTVKLWDANSGACLRTLRPERRYERLDITGLTGITDGQHAALLASGAIEQSTPGEVHQQWQSAIRSN